jgi:hypothetical protein
MEILSEQHRADLIEAYAQRVVDGMDLQDLVQLAMDSLMRDLDHYTDEALVAEIADFYPDLVEG